MKTLQDSQECLSRAYVTAVVGRARQALSWGSEHDYGVDGRVNKIVRHGSRRRELGFGFAFQLKASTDWFDNGTEIVYDLEAKNYNDMIAYSADGGGVNPLLLILLCLPKRRSSWMKVHANHLALRERAFVYKATGQPTQNTGTQRIKIPLKNVFRPGTVRYLVDQAAKGILLP